MHVRARWMTGLLAGLAVACSSANDGGQPAAPPAPAAGQGEQPGGGSGGDAPVEPVEPAPTCTEESCGANATCEPETGACLGPDSVEAMAGPVPECKSLPERDCKGSDCAKLMPFEPVTGRGYDNYPLNGETAERQYRSYARRDLQMLIKYATAYVDCKAKAWKGGNDKPLGLGDMSEGDGAIPGTSDGDPGHPAGTHVNGLDMDIAYYQTTPVNNQLRAICKHKDDQNRDQYHCLGAPTILDVPRTALFLGALITSDRVRIIGVDGQVGALMEKTMPELCKKGWLPQVACGRLASKVTWELTDEGRGWYHFHHHHLHVSMSNKAYPSARAGQTSPLLVDPDAETVGTSTLASDLLHLRGGVAGHAHVVDTPGAHR